jgi:hypothetical protein
VAKSRFKVYIEVDEEILQGFSGYENIIEALRDEFLRSKACGIDVKSIVDDDRCCNETVDLPIYITVVDGKVTEIWYDSHYNQQDYCLNDRDFSVTYESSQ